MVKKGKSPKWADIVRKMPPLYHTLPGRPFRLEDSEVVRWLLDQPAVVQALFGRAKNYLRYDGSTGKWSGRYHGEEAQK